MTSPRAKLNAQHTPPRARERDLPETASRRSPPNVPRAGQIEAFAKGGLECEAARARPQTAPPHRARTGQPGGGNLRCPPRTGGRSHPPICAEEPRVHHPADEQRMRAGKSSASRAVAVAIDETGARERPSGGPPSRCRE